MRFAEPQYFYLLLLLPILAGLFIYAWQKRVAALTRFADKKLIERLAPKNMLNRWILKSIIFLIAFMFLVIALTRPQFGVKTSMMERKGIDIMVALDISKSMLAEDIAPNRIDRAKHEISKFIDMLKGDRIGLVVFAGESFVQCPLTLDYGAARMFLKSVNTDWIELQGTALADAIEQSSKSLGTKVGKHKVLILISDGENHEGDAIKAAKKASKEGVKIYTVGLGSEKGAPIPIHKSSGSTVYKKEKNGDLVLTKLNSMTLEKIAIEGNGHYFHAGTDLDLTQIYSEISKMEKKNLGLNKMTSYREQYQIFLLLALFFIILEFLIPSGTKRDESEENSYE